MSPDPIQVACNPKLGDAQAVANKCGMPVCLCSFMAFVGLPRLGCNILLFLLLLLLYSPITAYQPLESAARS